MKRKWLPTLGELIDRLSIHQLKEVFIPENKKNYASEMQDMVHDIDMILKEHKGEITGEVVRAIVVLSQMNAHIWYNESVYNDLVNFWPKIKVGGTIGGDDIHYEEVLNDVEKFSKEYKVDVKYDYNSFLITKK